MHFEPAVSSVVSQVVFPKKNSGPALRVAQGRAGTWMEFAKCLHAMWSKAQLVQSGANSIQQKATLTHFDVAGLISTLSISVAFRQQYPFHEMRQCDMGLVAFSRTFGSKATASKATNMQAKDHVQGGIIASKSSDYRRFCL